MEDLAGIFGLSTNDVGPLQMSARAAVLLAYGLAVVRIFGPRIFGRWSPLDVLLSVLIGSNLSRALTGNSPLLATMVATTVLIALYWFLARMALKVPWISWLVKGREVLLITDGRVDWDEMRRQGLGPRDLDEALHAQGRESPDGIRRAWLERNGDITLLSR